MNLVEWDDRLLGTGHKVIDEQHKKLIDIINNLYRNFLDNKDDILSFSFKKSLHDVTEYVVYHFTTEEKIMEALNYNDKEKHFLEHRQFTETVSEMVASLEQKNNPNIKFLSKKLLVLLRHWLINHISDVDRKFVRECAALAKNKIDH